jgi:uncharacterized repeat protein (TIGR01451 family)
MVLWMGEQSIGNPDTKDAMFAVGTATQLPNMTMTAPDAAFAAGEQRTLNLLLLNQGTGDARNVTLSGSLPTGLAAVSISDPDSCSITGQVFNCVIAEIPADRSRTVSMTVSSASEGSYTVTASVASDGLDADMADNSTAFGVNVSAAVPVPDPDLTPQADDGGGCTMAVAGAPLDPVLPLLAGLGLLGLALRRVSPHRLPGGSD